MTILDRANAFIGHEQEVDEGYETTMRRNAFIAGFKEALELVRKMNRTTKHRLSGVKAESCSCRNHGSCDLCRTHSIHNDLRGFVSLVKQLREIQKEWDNQLAFDFSNWEEKNKKKEKLESEVDKWLKML